MLIHVQVRCSAWSVPYIHVPVMPQLKACLSVCCICIDKKMMHNFRPVRSSWSLVQTSLNFCAGTGISGESMQQPRNICDGRSVTTTTKNNDNSGEFVLPHLSFTMNRHQIHIVKILPLIMTYHHSHFLMCHLHLTTFSD